MQSEAMIRKAAEAIWAIRREEEDRCDMSLDDMGGEESSVWHEAKAALQAVLSTDDMIEAAKAEYAECKFLTDEEVDTSIRRIVSAAIAASLSTDADPVKPEGTVGEMTPDRAIYFLERFKREEKMLGPHEQWALDFAISVLSPAEPVKTAPAVAVKINDVADRVHRVASALDTPWFENIEKDLRAISAALSAQVQDTRNDDDEETYQIGIRDGYSQAVQKIDRLTGGDGEYRYCTDHDPERHTPGPAEMIQRIVDRFETLNLIDDAEKLGDFWDTPGSAQVQDVAGPVAYLRPCKITTMRDEFESLTTSEKGHPKAFPVYAATPALSEPVAEIVSKHGDPEAFGERELVALVDIQKFPYRTKLYAAAPAKQEG